MKNYINIDGQNTPFSDETIQSIKNLLKDQIKEEVPKEEAFDLKEGDVYYFIDRHGDVPDAICLQPKNLGPLESKNKATLERAVQFIELQNYADKVNGGFGEKRYFLYLNGKTIYISSWNSPDGTVYFSSRKLAQQALDHFGKDFFMRLFRVK